MARLTHQQIYENRLKAIEWLMAPNRRKAVGELRDNKGGRCCLGHMSDALGVMCKLYKKPLSGDSPPDYLYGENEENIYAPEELMTKVGFWENDGSNLYNTTMSFKSFKFISLAELNDRNKISPKTIGEYLQSVIMGGEDTPWKPIKIKG